MFFHLSVSAGIILFFFESLLSSPMETEFSLPVFASPLKALSSSWVHFEGHVFCVPRRGRAVVRDRQGGSLSVTMMDSPAARRPQKQMVDSGGAYDPSPRANPSATKPGEFCVDASARPETPVTTYPTPLTISSSRKMPMAARADIGALSVTVTVSMAKAARDKLASAIHPFASCAATSRSRRLATRCTSGCGDD